MAVATTNAFSGPFTANGVTTIFPFTFTVLSGADVTVALRDADGVETTVSANDYSVTLTGDGPSAGSVTFDVAPATGNTVWLYLAPDFTQETEFVDGHPFIAGAVNNANDRAALRDQVLRRDVDRALLVPIGEAGVALPTADERAGKYLMFDADGAAQMDDPDNFAGPASAASALSQAWAEGTLPGGAGTKSAKEWSEVSEAEADAAALSAATAEAASGPTYASTAAGLAATTSGEAFAVDAGGGLVSVYLNSAGTAVLQRTLATTAYLASSAGAGAVGFDPAINYGVTEIGASVSREINLRRYGFVGNGSADDLTAFNDAVVDATAAQTGYGTTGGYSAGAWKFIIPNTGSPIYISGQVVIPAGVNVIFSAEQPGWGTLIKSDADYVFRKAASGSGSFGWAEWEGISFLETGIQIDGNWRGMFKVHKGNFIDTPNVAVLGNGNSIVRGIIEQTKFSGCAGGVKFTGSDVDLITVRQNDFVRGHTNPHVELGTFFSVVEDNDFETMAAASGPTVPYVRFIRGGFNLIKNRFGDEVATGFVPPRDAVQIGPDAYSSTAVTTGVIERNTFRGTNGTVSTTEAASCVRLNAPTQGLLFRDNIIPEQTNFGVAVIHEAYISNTPGDVSKSYDNEASGNHRQTDLTIPFYSAGGVGWDGERAGVSTASRTNLLRLTNDLSNATLWLKTNCTVTYDATGPDGVANSAATVQKSSTGNATVRGQLVGTSANTDGLLVVRVPMRAGTMNRARVYLIQTTDNRVISSGRVIHLKNEWRDYDVLFAGIDPAKTYFAYIAVGADTATDQALTGNILVGEPSAFNGKDIPAVVLPNIHTGGTQHAAPQYRSLVLGQRYIGYGSAAPTTGRYEQGDLFFNIAPTAGGTVGWVCVTGGSPGVWKTFGTITA